MDHLETLPFIVAPPATPLLKRAARLGRELGLTFYDASFIALAVELDCPYITADRRLYDRARSLPAGPPPFAGRLPVLNAGYPNVARPLRIVDAIAGVALPIA